MVDPNQEAFREGKNGETRTTAVPENDKLNPPPLPDPPFGHLIQQTMNGDSHVREAAVVTFGELGATASQAIPTLVPLLVDKQPAVRKAAEESLGQIDPQWPLHPRVQSLIEKKIRNLGSRSLDVQQEAHALLVRLGKRAVPALNKAFSDEKSDTRQCLLARVFEHIGPDAEEAVSVLAKELTCDKVHVRRAVGEALAAIGTIPQSALPGLILDLADWDAEVRCSAARCLARMGPGTESAIPTLFQLLLDRDERVREAAIEALAHTSDAAIPLLLEFLRLHDFEQIQQWLEKKVKALDWRSIPQHLEPFMKERVNLDELRREPEKALHSLEWFIRNLVEDVERMELARCGAIRVIGEIGLASAETILASPETMTVLIESVPDKSWRVRLEAVRCFKKLGPLGKEGCPVLVKALIDENGVVRKAAADSLDSIDPYWQNNPAVEPAIATLFDTLKQAQRVSPILVDALVRVGAPAVPALAEALSSGRRTQREAAITILGQIGAKAEAAIPSLVQTAREDKLRWIREAAFKALQRIAPADSQALIEGKSSCPG